MMKTYIALFAVALAACTNGQAEVDVTATTAALFPGPPADVRGQVPTEAMTTDGVVTLDFQKDLASLANMGTLTAVISKNAISGPDLSFVDHIKATIATEDGKIPEQLAFDVDVPRNTTELELALLISDSQVLDYMTEGKVAIHFYLTGTIPPRALTLTHTMIAHVSVAVKGSVLKL
jgi:hypothetical protein